MRYLVATACCSLLFGVGTAQAGNPRVIDPAGSAGHGVVDGTGALHLVWLHDGGANDDDTIRYCKVPRGPGGCAAPPKTLAVPVPHDADVGVGTPFIYRQGDTLRVVLVMSGIGRLYVWTSADLGATFSSAVLEADNTFSLFQQAEPGVQEGSTLVYNAGSFVQGITFGGGTATGTDYANLEDSSHVAKGDADMERVPGIGHYVAGDLGVGENKALIWVHDLGAVNDKANWTLTDQLDSTTAPRFVAANTGLYAITSPSASGPFRLNVHGYYPIDRRFTPGVELPGPAKHWRYYNATYAAGRIWLVASTGSGSPIGLQLWTGTNASNWNGPSTINPSTTRQYYRPQLAVAEDGKGWVVYDEVGDRVTVEDLTTPAANPGNPGTPGNPGNPGNPVNPVNPTPSGPTLFTTPLGKTVKKVHGSSITFFSPKKCVPQGRTFTAVYNAKHGKKAKAKGYVKTLKVSFRVLTLSKKQIKGAGKSVVDSKKPFQTRKLSTAGLAKGKSYLLRSALEYRRSGVGSKKQRLKKRKKSIYRKLNVCS